MSGFLPTPQDKFWFGLCTVEVDRVTATGMACARLDHTSRETLEGVR